ncbi:MAG: DUF4412 domain-containing protein [Blastocatellia bacterium]
MIRLAVSRIHFFPQSLKIISFLSLLLFASLATACSKDSSSSSTTPASSSSATVSGGGKFEGTITAKMMPGSERPMEAHYAIKGPRIRVETQLAQGGSAMGVVLMDLSAGTNIMLMPQTKTYMSMNQDSGKFKEMADAAAKISGEANTGDLYKVTNTGQTETVAGYSCQHWLMGSKKQTDVCLAKGLGQTGSILDQLKTLGLDEQAKAQIQANPEFLKFAESGAFPMKMSQIENGQSKMIMEVTNVERKTLDDSLFAVPSDYKKMEIPGMPGNKR